MSLHNSHKRTDGTTVYDDKDAALDCVLKQLRCITYWSFCDNFLSAFLSGLAARFLTQWPPAHLALAGMPYGQSAPTKHYNSEASKPQYKWLYATDRLPRCWSEPARTVELLHLLFRWHLHLLFQPPARTRLPSPHAECCHCWSRAAAINQHHHHHLL